MKYGGYKISTGNISWPEESNKVIFSGLIFDQLHYMTTEMNSARVVQKNDDDLPERGQRRKP